MARSGPAVPTLLAVELAELRLRRLSSGSSLVELPVNVLASFPELIHALPQAPRQIRQLFRPEEDKNDEEDDK